MIVFHPLNIFLFKLSMSKHFKGILLSYFQFFLFFGACRKAHEKLHQVPQMLRTTRYRRARFGDPLWRANSFLSQYLLFLCFFGLFLPPSVCDSFSQLFCPATDDELIQTYPPQGALRRRLSSDPSSFYFAVS